VADEVTYGALATASRRRLLELLRAAGSRLDVAALAAASGLHPNTVRFHLDVLVRAGFVQEYAERSGTRGRPRTVYAPSSPAGGDESGYRLLANMLVTHLDDTGAGGSAERAGRSWARRVMPADPSPPGETAAVVRRVVALFTEMGFEPSVVPHGHGQRVLLHACPFQALAEEHPGVVCAVHLGLLREVVEQATAGAVQADLSPFVQPRLCAADIVPAASAGTR
jgi:predicted ArsR family transcriptional regulator